MNKETENRTEVQKAATISTILAGVSILAFIVLLMQVLGNDVSDRLVQSWAGVSVVGFLALITSVGAGYSRKGRMNRGMALAALGFIVVLLAVPFIVKGRAIFAATITVGLVVIIVPQLFSLRIANRAVALFVAVGTLSVSLDAWLPFARDVSSEQTPYALFVFGVGLLIFVVVAASQYRQLMLRTKILTFMVFVPLVIVAGVGTFFIVRLSNQQRIQVEEGIKTVLLEQVDDTFAFLNDAEADVQLLSQSYALNNYLALLNAGAPAEEVAVAKTAVQSAFVSYAQTRLIYYQIRFLDAAGQEIIRVDTSLDGVTTVIPEDQLQNKADRAYFADAVQVGPGELYISPMELNVERGEIERPFKPVIRYGTPVYLDGNLQGVVVTNVYASFILDHLAESAQNAYLVDENGYFLLHPDPAKTWGRDLATNIRMTQELPEIADRVQDSQEIPDSGEIVETDTDLFVMAPIRLGAESAPRWYLLNSLPLLDVLTPVNDALAPVQNVLAIALMLTPLLALLVSQSISSPIVQLTDAAQQIGQRNFDVVIEVNSRDEVGILANTLNRMSAELGQLVGSLETRVAERTKDLTLAVEVSNRVSQVHTLDSMLASAVTLIHDRFDLYYTQIYLLDGSTLHLAAGSGEVGQQLMRRGHQLPIGPGSINGTAVAEMRSVIVADTADNPLFKANPLLPKTRSEMSVPLIIRSQVIGALNLQSSVPNALTEENQTAFEVLAGQLASAIENVRLFDELDETRTFIEAQMNLLTREGWDNYLDGVHNREFLGYVAKDGQVTAVSQPSPARQNQQKWDIQILNEKLGELIIEPSPHTPLTPESAELIQIVGQQIGQRIENLRLLSDAQRYREEAESAIKRLTREGWQSYQDQNELSGFVYDGFKVQPLAASYSNGSESEFASAPLQIQGETIGHLQVDGIDETFDSAAKQLLAAVAQQLGNHIDNLRLTQQTQQALTQTERLYKIGSQLNQAGDLQAVLDVTVAPLKPLGANEATLMFVQLNEMGEPQLLELLANWREDGNASFPVGTRFKLEEFPFTNLFMSSPQEPQFIADVATDLHVDAFTRQVMQQVGIGAIVIVPLTIAGQWVGILTYSWPTPFTYSQTLKDFFAALINLTAPVVQSQRLFAKTRSQAEKERLINVITQRIQGANTVESALQTAVAELGQVFRAQHTEVKLNLAKLSLPEKETATNGHA